MALSIVGTPVGTDTNGVSNANLTPALPGTIATDDLILLATCTQSAPTTAFGTGYTQFTGSPAGQSNVGSNAGWKLAGVSEANPTVSLGAAGQWCAGTIVIRGADTTTPIVAADLFSSSAFSTKTFPPALDTGGTTCISVLILANENTSGTITWPTGWTQRYTQTNGGFGPVFTIATNSSPGLGSVNPGVITMTNARQAIVWHVLVGVAAGVPDAPTTVYGVPEVSAATVNWSLPSNNGSTITDYVIEYASGGGYTTVSHSASTERTIKVTGLTPGVAYTFRISAVNGNGTGATLVTPVTTTPLSANLGPPYIFWPGLFKSNGTIRTNTLSLGDFRTIANLILSSNAGAEGTVWDTNGNAIANSYLWVSVVTYLVGAYWGVRGF